MIVDYGRPGTRWVPGTRAWSRIPGPPLSRRRAQVMAKIGYARVSTRSQNDDSQVDELTAYGCEKIFTDTGLITGNVAYSTVANSFRWPSRTKTTGDGGRSARGRYRGNWRRPEVWMTALTSRPTLPAPRIRGRKEERPSSDQAREAASGARASSVPATLSAGGSRCC